MLKKTILTELEERDLRSQIYTILTPAVARSLAAIYEQYSEIDDGILSGIVHQILDSGIAAHRNPEVEPNQLL